MMEELPKGWTTSNIESLFRSFSGGTPSKSVASYWNGAIPWLSSGDIKSDRIKSSTYTISTSGLRDSSARLCRTGSVVVVVRSGILKHTLPVAILNYEAAINQDIKCFDSGNDELNRWFAMALKASAGDILALNREGTTVQSVKYETLKSFQLPLPPAAEQQRILQKLDKLLAKADECQERLARIPIFLNRFRQSVLASACSGRLTVDWREENSIDAASWRTRTIGSICEIIGGSQPPKKHFVYKEQKGYIRFIQIRDYKSDRNLTYIPKEMARRFCSTTDVMIGRYGPPLFQILRGIEGSYNVALMKAVPISNHDLNNDFLFILLQYPPLRNYIISSSERTVGQDGVRKDLLEEYEVNLPLIDEQKEIVRRVNELFALAEKIEVRYKAVQGLVDRLPQSILSRAFQGELVPTEAELAGREGRPYESAEQLLQRIRSAKPKADSIKRNGQAKNGRHAE